MQENENRSNFSTFVKRKKWRCDVEITHQVNGLMFLGSNETLLRLWLLFFCQNDGSDPELKQSYESDDSEYNLSQHTKSKLRKG